MNSLLVSSLMFIPSLSKTPVTLPNSCINQEDGEQWVQLSQSSPSDMMPLHLLCSSEYVILDLNKDSNVAQYITNFEDLTNDMKEALTSKDLSTLSYNSWFVPSVNNDIDAKNIISAISSDCVTCDITQDTLLSLEETSDNYCLCYKPNELQSYELTASQVSVLGSLDAKEADGEEGNDEDGENEINKASDEIYTGFMDAFVSSLKMRLALIGFALLFSTLLLCACFRIQFGPLIDLSRNSSDMMKKDVDAEADDDRVSETRVLITGKYGSV